MYFENLAVTVLAGHNSQLGTTNNSPEHPISFEYLPFGRVSEACC